MNVDGMLPFENMVADYVKETENHVMYRVTPIFEGSNLVASGVLMEAISVEDNGRGIEFCVYVYNCQPGIIIDYRTGASRLETNPDAPSVTPDENEENNTENSSGNGENVDTGTLVLYIVNTNTGKFHLESCRYVKQIKDSNRKDMTTTREHLIEEGCSPCKTCNP